MCSSNGVAQFIHDLRDVPSHEPLCGQRLTMTSFPLPSPFTLSSCQCFTMVCEGMRIVLVCS